jgi:hypothetical protein
MGVREDAQELAITQAKKELTTLMERLRNVGGMVGLTKPPHQSPPATSGAVGATAEEPAQQESPVVPTEAVEPATEDLVEVRTPRFEYYTDGNGGYNPTAKTWTIRAGYTVSHRPRRPEDGDALVVIEEDPPQPAPVIERGESRGEWITRVVNQGASGPTAVHLVAGRGAERTPGNGTRLFAGGSRYRR